MDDRSILEEVRSLVAKTDRVLEILEGDEYSPGLRARVRSNSEAIDELLIAYRRTTDDRKPLAVTAISLFFVLTPLYHAVLVSDIRVLTGVGGWDAVIVASVLFGVIMALGVFALKTFLAY